MYMLSTTLIGAIVGLNTQSPLGLRYFQQDRYDIADYAASILVILSVSIVFAILVIFALFTPLQNLTQVPAVWLIVAVVSAAAQFLVSLRLTVLQAAGRPVRFGVLRIFQALLDVGLSLLFLLVLALGWQGRLVGITLAAVAAATAAMIFMRVERLLSFRPRITYIQDAVKFGAPLIPHVIGGTMLVMVDRVIITNVLGVGETGIYLLAMQVGMAFNLISDSVNKALAPWLLATLNKRDANRDLRLVDFTYVYFFVVFVASIAFGYVAGLALPYIAGPEYASASDLIFYIVLGFSFTGMYLMVTNYVFFAEKTGKLAFTTISVAVISSSLCYVLVSLYGLRGAAISFAVSQALLFVAVWVLSSRVHPMPWTRRFHKIWTHR